MSSPASAPSGPSGPSGRSPSRNGDSASSGGIDQKTLQKILSGYGTDSDADYLATVVKSKVGAKYLRVMKPEFDRANVLANRSDAETYEARWLIRLRTNAYLHEHPPEGSKMSGSFRRLVYGSDKKALSPGEVREIMAIEQVLLARVTQSRNMEQQRIIKEMRSEQSLTREDSRATGGIGAKIKQAFK
ncbi:hypothetical protein A4G99_03765 [Haladaptatus sp. R4]|uniref:hypothetical protein n=1 Tax=Haladaptatus sp. R4 TaxID=1679489 RepID=UPI0007B4A937|nr:hypothetical protein [Haladaptatus sp. R4]KZN25597.1 hypothetical protein A4G99_03765 [Haladaptatus sp. R4]